MRTRAIVVAAVVIGLAIGFVVMRRGDRPAAVLPPPPLGAPSVASAPVPSTPVTAARVAAVVPSAAPSGLRLEGQVIDGEHRPVGGATVGLVEPARTTTSEADGSFGLDGLTAGRYTLYATTGDGYTEDVEAALTPTSDPITLYLRRGGAVVVTVVEADGGAPIAGATVGDGRRTATTDAAGHARLAGLPSGVAHVEARAPDHGPVITAVAIGRREAERTIALARGAALGGRVVDPRGAPVAGADVELEGRHWKGEVRSDASGGWQVAALARDTYAITASSDTFGEADAIMVAVDGVHPRTGVVVAVAAGGQLVGRVVDAGGGPVAGASVTAESPAYHALAATADAAGRFELLGLPTSRFAVWAAAGGQASPRTEVMFRDEQRVELRLVIAASSVAGTVVDRDGEPVADARVVATGGATVVEDRTDAGGRFTLAVPHGAYTIQVAPPDGHARAPRAIHASAGDHAIRVVLP